MIIGLLVGAIFSAGIGLGYWMGTFEAEIRQKAAEIDREWDRLDAELARRRAG